MSQIRISLVLTSSSAGRFRSTLRVKLLLLKVYPINPKSTTMRYVQFGGGSVDALSVLGNERAMNFAIRRGLMYAGVVS